MKSVYDENVALLNTKGEKLAMDEEAMGYSRKSDQGPAIPGYTTRGVSKF